MKKLTFITFIALLSLSTSSCDSSDDNNTAQDNKALILGTWAKTLTITSNGNEVQGSLGCPDTWKFLQNTVKIKDYTLIHEPPCGELDLDVVREYDIIDNVIKVFSSDGTTNTLYEIRELTSTNLSFSNNGTRYDWVKQ